LGETGAAKTGGLLAIGTRAFLIAFALENAGTTNIGGG
jgi:glutamate formiminotransferase